MRLNQVFNFLSRRKPAAQPPKEPIVSNKEQPFIYTDEQLMARLKFFIGICLALTLTGIVFVVLYSIIFVTQPLNAMSPIDQKFFELIIPIATFLTGTLSGIMLAGNKKEDQEAMLAAQKQAAANAESAAKSAAAAPAPVTNSWGSQPLGGFNNGSNTFGSTAAFGAASSTGFGPNSSAPSAFGPGTSEVTTGWGGKAAPPPTTEWPER
jgi:hypothetical protein